MWEERYRICITFCFNNYQWLGMITLVTGLTMINSKKIGSLNNIQKAKVVVIAVVGINWAY